MIVMQYRKVTGFRIVESAVKSTEMRLAMFQIDQVRRIVGSGNVREQEPMALHTTFRIGGPAEVLAEPENSGQLQELMQYCREEKKPWFILGNGSNLLISDRGYDGVMISTRRFDQINFTEEKSTQGIVLVEAGGGVMLSRLAACVAEQELSGFEFAAGIPGTLGGAVTMNAGAYGGEIKDVIVSATVLTPEGEIHELSREELAFSYRHSIVQEKNMIVLAAKFAFRRGDGNVIRNTIRELNARRREKQPLEYGSAGSTFKRPEGYFAGKLIEDAGLRGYRVGDVMVSEKHCGFVVNVGNGTFEQAIAVIRHVQKTVQEKFGVMLETEVMILE